MERSGALGRTDQLEFVDDLIDSYISGAEQESKSRDGSRKVTDLESFNS